MVWDILILVMGVWCILSPIILMYGAFHPESERSKKIEWIYTMAFLGTGIAGMLLCLGFYSLLAFIPSVKGRLILSVVLAIPYWYGFIVVYDRIHGLVAEKQERDEQHWRVYKKKVKASQAALKQVKEIVESPAFGTLPDSDRIEMEWVYKGGALPVLNRDNIRRIRGVYRSLFQRTDEPEEDGENQKGAEGEKGTTPGELPEERPV